MAVKTIGEEKVAILNLVRSVVGVRSFYEYEPKVLAGLPAITIQFAGIPAAQAATLRHARQDRQYDVRLYVGLEDMKIAQETMEELIIDVWDKLVAAQRLGDGANVILTSVGDTQINWITDERAQRMYLEGKVRVETNHRSPYVT